MCTINKTKLSWNLSTKEKKDHLAPSTFLKLKKLRSGLMKILLEDEQNIWQSQEKIAILLTLSFIISSLLSYF